MNPLSRLPKPILYAAILAAIVAAILILGDIKVWVEQ